MPPPYVYGLKIKYTKTIDNDTVEAWKSWYTYEHEWKKKFIIICRHI